MQFSYKLEDKLDIKWVAIIYSGSAFVLIVLAGVVIIVVARACIIRAIKKNQEAWHNMAISMSKVVNQAGTKVNQMMMDTPGMMGNNIPPSRQVMPVSRYGNNNFNNGMGNMNNMNNMNNMGNMGNMGMGNNMPNNMMGYNNGGMF